MWKATIDLSEVAVAILWVVVVYGYWIIPGILPWGPSYDPTYGGTIHEATLGTGATVVPDLLVEIAIEASPLITGTLPALSFKKRTGGGKPKPKLVLEVPAGNWPDLAALDPSVGACTMQFRTPCEDVLSDEDAFSPLHGPRP